ncbi:hypothetical protein [Mycobacterium servetii]|uniref:Alanine and proline rich membrane protein n=1 Tax=Mycobacterium servetii TaxID=3237418 RepID=A0ABV4C999_9MYCO
MDFQGPPPPHPWQQPQPPYPAYAPPPPGRRWFPIAVIAAILVAGALIAAAIVIAGGDKSHPAAAPITTAQPAMEPPEATATCKAWRAADAALATIPALPEGWDWNTPNIDTLSSNAKTAVDKVLDIFESRVAAGDPQQVVEAAKSYIATKRADMSKLVDHTITTADDAAVEVSLATLQQLCGGEKDHG